MSNIKLVRIDNRLVHGQVGVVWISSVSANLLVVVDDIVADDKIQQQLMGITAKSSSVGIRFFGVEQAISTLPKASPSQKIFIVCRTPEVAKKLVDANIGITTINVGNMHFAEGKTQLSAKVFVDTKDLEELQYIKSKNIDITIQDSPSDQKKDIQ